MGETYYRFSFALNMGKRLQNFDLAVYLAWNHRDEINDDKLKAIAKEYNMKWRRLKRNFEYACWVNDSIQAMAKELKNGKENC